MTAAPVRLYRNARAVRRHAWDGPEALRPLAPEGVRQARRVAEQAPAELAAIWTSPALRCRQTVELLARKLGLDVQVCEFLAKGRRAEKALELVRAQAECGPLVCCTHTDLEAELAALLEEEEVPIVRWPRTPEPGEDAVQRLGVLDLGSNSFHLLVADATPSGHLQPVDRERVQLRLGAVIGTRERIPEHVFERAVRTAETLRAEADALGTGTLIAVGTAALREASNGDALAAALAEAIGEPIRLLSGEQEARTVFRAIRRRVELPPRPVLGLDLGGGSLELVVGEDPTIHFEASLPLGAARLHSELVGSDPMRKKDLRAVADRVQDLLEPVRERVRAFGPEACVATGGSARALGDLALGLRANARPDPVNGLELSLAELRQTSEILIHSTPAERNALAGIRRRRTDLLPTAALILLVAAEALGIEAYTLCDWGLREGVMLGELDLARD